MSQELNGILSNESNLSGSINNGANLIGSFIQGGGGGTSDYNDLDNKPKINNVTLSGNKTSHDLGLMPETTLAAVATSGDYDDLIDKPELAEVATSGDYDDLNNKPVIPDMTDYYNKTETDSLLDDKFDKDYVEWVPVVNQIAVGIVVRGIDSHGNYINTITNKGIGPFYTESETDNLLAQKANSSSLAAVATSGDYNDLSNKPVIPSNNVVDISDQFTITKSSGNWSVDSVEAYRSGNIIQATIKFNGNGSSVSAGSNGFVGRITAGPLPVSTVRLVGYYNNCPVMLNVDPDGALTARVTAVNVTVSTTGILPLGGIYLTNN